MCRALIENRKGKIFNIRELIIMHTKNALLSISQL